MHVYIPYTGVYYAHNDFLGAVARLDISFSPLTILSLDAEQRLGTDQNPIITTFDGLSITGCQFGSNFEWSYAASESFLLGAVAKYDYQAVSGGVTLRTTRTVISIFSGYMAPHSLRRHKLHVSLLIMQTDIFSLPHLSIEEHLDFLG